MLLPGGLFKSCEGLRSQRAGQESAASDPSHDVEPYLKDILQRMIIEIALSVATPTAELAVRPPPSQLNWSNHVHLPPAPPEILIYDGCTLIRHGACQAEAYPCASTCSACAKCTLLHEGKMQLISRGAGIVWQPAKR